MPIVSRKSWKSFVDSTTLRTLLWCTISLTTLDEILSSSGRGAEALQDRYLLIAWKLRRLIQSGTVSSLSDSLIRIGYLLLTSMWMWLILAVSRFLLTCAKR